MPNNMNRSPLIAERSFCPWLLGKGTKVREYMRLQILINATINNLKTGMLSIPLRVSITLFIVCFVTVGCTLIKLKKDTNRSQESTVIVGRIDAKFLGSGPIIVAACSMGKRNEVAHYTVLHDSGEYELMVDQGEYYVVN